MTRGLGKTGVVGSLSKGDSPRTIGLRADMDALPIEETTGLPPGQYGVGENARLRS